MNYKGTDVRNVFHLRTPEDANSIARLANNKNAVIVGTSFVGEKNTHLQEYFDTKISVLVKCWTTRTAPCILALMLHVYETIL